MMEEIYIGTKIIAAEEMDERNFVLNVKKGTWGENQPSRLGYKVRYEDGYVSWSPRETFERAYRKLSYGEERIVGISGEGQVG